MEFAVNDKAYDRLAARLVERLRESEIRGSRAVWAALERASRELLGQGIVSEAQVRRLQECIARDLAHLASVAVRGRRTERKAVRREAGALALLLEVLHLSGDAVFRLAGEAGRVELRLAGEVTCAGVSSCLECGRIRCARNTFTVSPCTRCGGVRFVKGFVRSARRPAQREQLAGVAHLRLQPRGVGGPHAQQQLLPR